MSPAQEHWLDGAEDSPRGREGHFWRVGNATDQARQRTATPVSATLLEWLPEADGFANSSRESKSASTSMLRLRLRAAF